MDDVKKDVVDSVIQFLTAHIREELSGLSTEELLKFDSLARAEKLTGQSYKDDQATTALGIVILQEVRKAKENRMAAEDDVNFSCGYEKFIRVAESMGFEQAYKEEVEFDSKYGDGKQKEILFVYADRIRGTVLVMQTYNMSSVNMATIYWQGRGTRAWGNSSSPHEVDEHYEFTYSKDVREGLRSTIRDLESLKGFEFIPVWNKYDFSGCMPKFVSYWDWYGYDFQDPNPPVKIAHERRVKLMPEWFTKQFGNNLGW